MRSEMEDAELGVALTLGSKPEAVVARAGGTKEVDKPP
jgi:hypothetical protein